MQRWSKTGKAVSSRVNIQNSLRLLYPRVIKFEHIDRQTDSQLCTVFSVFYIVFVVVFYSLLYAFLLLLVVTGVGINSASKYWNAFWSRFSNISDIICISGGYQDLLPGFYQVFTFNSQGFPDFRGT